MPLGTNINTNKHNRTQPNQEKQKIWQEIEVFPTPFKITPTPEILESKDSKIKKC